MDSPNTPPEGVHAPLEKTANRLSEPFRDFIGTESSCGWLLLCTTFAAVVIANSRWNHAYFDLLHIEFGLKLAGVTFQMTLQHWVNDGLMALFFFLLGLELKRELLVGQLRQLRNASAVLCAASGGMLLPAALFLAAADTHEISKGWAIPVATDTAFALMLLVLLGNRIPASARAFLVGLAVVDDLGAIVVIAIGYTSQFDTAPLIPVSLCLAVLFALNLGGVRSGVGYLVVGVVLWALFLRMGLHGTLAGVVVACAAPVRPAIARRSFVEKIEEKIERFKEKHDTATATILEQPEQHDIARDVLHVASEATAPLRRWETRLQKPISFVVMPTFALMNAGVAVSGDALKVAWASGLSTAILLGLLIGKPLGILSGIALGKLTRIAELPATLTWRHLIGLAMLGGIGFTMSLFIATLSFADHPQLLEIAKQCVIGTSVLAGVLGYAWLRWACQNPSS